MPLAVDAMAVFWDLLAWYFWAVLIIFTLAAIVGIVAGGDDGR